ncbi:MAG: MFS transporter [Phycisphaerae bacterium]
MSKSGPAFPPLLRNWNFILLWGAYAISAFGDNLSEMAIFKTLNIAEGEVDITPLTARKDFVFFLPFMLMAPFAGVLADRFSRRALMIGADIVRMLIFLFFSSLLLFFKDWGSYGAFLPLLPIGLMAAVFSPSRAALLPTVIHPTQLVRANGMISGMGIIASMMAVLIGGYLAQHYEPILSFRLDAATFFVSALLLILMRPPRAQNVVEHERPPVRMMQNVREGAAYIRTHRRVLELIGISLVVWLCGPLVKSIIPTIVVKTYEGGYDSIGQYLGLLGAGFVVGAICMTLVGGSVRSYAPIGFGLWGISLGMILLSISVFAPLDVSSRRWIGGFGIFVAGFSAIMVMATYNALLQRIVPDRYLGRVFGVKDLITMSALLVPTGALAIPKWEAIDEWVGYLLLLVAVITFAVGMTVVVARLRRSPMTPLLTLTYDLNEFVVQFLWRAKKLSPCTVPNEGGVVITANHGCPADPCMLGLACNYRRISFLIAAEYRRWPLVNYLVWVLKCIPVKRDGSDAGATKRALRHLKDGHCMGIFIQGSIVPPGEDGEPKDGVAMLALRGNAQVIPAYISGGIYRDTVVAGLMMPHKLRVRYGPPVDLSEFRGKRVDRDVLQAATQKIYESIKALSPEAIAARKAGLDGPSPTTAADPARSGDSQ